MIQDPNHNELFETRLQQEADEFQISPFAGSWNRIRSGLRRSRRRKIAAALFGAVLSVLAVYLLIIKPEQNQPLAPASRQLPDKKEWQQHVPSKAAEASEYTSMHLPPKRSTLRRPRNEVPAGCGASRQAYHSLQQPIAATPSGKKTEPSASQAGTALPEFSLARLPRIVAGESRFLSTDLSQPPQEAALGRTVPQRVHIQAAPEVHQRLQGDTTRHSDSVSGHWETSWYFSPAIGYRFARSPSGDDHTSAGASTFASTAFLKFPKNLWQYPGVGFAAGINLLHPWHKGWLLGSGLQFSRQTYRVMVYQALAASIQSNGRSGALVDPGRSNSSYSLLAMAAAPYLPKSSETKTNVLESLSLPVWLGKDLLLKGTQRIRFLSGILVSKRIYDNELIFSPYTLRYFKNEALVRSWNLQMNLTAAYRFSLNHYWAGSMGPTFQIQVLQSLKSSYPIHSHMYLLGWQLSLHRL